MNQLLKYKSEILVIFLSLILSGCYPAIFTGTAASATAFAKDRSAKDTVNDLTLSANIKAKIAKKGMRKYYSKINIEVINAAVMLTGQVETQADIVFIVDLVWQVEGVKEVINELRVNKNADYFDLMQYTRDALITSQIKTKMMITKGIKSVNFSILTEKDRVYIFGLARSMEELRLVSEIAANVNKVKEVINYAKVLPPKPELADDSVYSADAPAYADKPKVRQIQKEVRRDHNPYHEDVNELERDLVDER